MPAKSCKLDLKWHTGSNNSLLERKRQRQKGGVQVTELYWQLYNRLSFADEGDQEPFQRQSWPESKSMILKVLENRSAVNLKRESFTRQWRCTRQTEYLPVIEERRTAHIERAKQKKATSLPIPQSTNMAFLTYTDIWHQRSIRRLSFTEDTKHTKLQHEIFKSHVPWENVMTLDTALIIYPACLIFPGSCVSANLCVSQI